MTLSKSYHDIMEHIEVTPEMRERILAGMPEPKTVPASIVRARRIRRAAPFAAAACLALAMVGVALFNPGGNLTQDVAPVVESVATTTSSTSASPEVAASSSESAPAGSSVQDADETNAPGTHATSATANNDGSNADVNAASEEGEDQPSGANDGNTAEAPAQEPAVTPKPSESTTSPKGAATSTQQEDTPHSRDSGTSTSADKSDGPAGVVKDTTYANAAKLATAADLPLSDVGNLPFKAKKTSYDLLEGSIAQAVYANGGNKITYRVAKGSDDIESGSYARQKKVTVNGVAVTLHGDEGFSLATWRSGGRSYSLSSTTAYERSTWESMLETIVP